MCGMMQCQAPQSVPRVTVVGGTATIQPALAGLLETWPPEGEPCPLQTAFAGFCC